MKVLNEIKKKRGKDGSPRVFYGWWIVAACATIGLLTNTARSSFTMWFPHMLEGIEGATRTNLGFGTTLLAWLASIMALVAGLLLDKYGPRILMIFGGFLTIVGLAMASRAATLWEFYLWFGVVLGIAGAATHGIPTHITGRYWFKKKAGLAVAISTIGGTLGIAVIAFLGPFMIERLGWRTAWFWLGIMTGVPTILLAWFVIRKDPESMGLRPDGEPPLTTNDTAEVEKTDLVDDDEEVWTIKEALKTRSYWFLVIGHAIYVIFIAGSVGHVVVWAMDIARRIGVPAAEAMPMAKLGVALMAVGAIVGMMFGGPLSDRFGRKLITCLSFILLGICWIFGGYLNAMWQVPVWTFCNAATYGLGATIWAAIMGDIYGRKSMATLYGLLTLVGGLIGGSGPWLMGFIYDTTGSYFSAFIMASITCLISLLLLVFTDQKPARRPVL